VAVTNATAQSIDLFTIDTSTGVPTPVAGSPISDGPAAVAVAIDPLKRYLYVLASSGSVRGYEIVPSPLGLNPVGGGPFSTGGPSAGIAVDPSGKFVLTANGTGDSVSVFKIGSTGGLAQVAGSPFPAGSNPTAIIVARGHYVYAANTAGSSVSAYSLDTTSGVLTPVAGSPFATSGQPNGLVVDPTGTHVYATQASPNGVYGFTLDTATGALSALPGTPFEGSYGAHPVQTPVMDSGGIRLHVANGIGVDCFQVDLSNGTLTDIGMSYTIEQNTLALSLDGPDNFLFVLDGVDKQIEVFSIDPSTGNLTLINGNPFALFPGASSQNLGADAISVQH
jgi:6-phosphogluconolactonase (cycloisomerase 2 family)